MHSPIAVKEEILLDAGYFCKLLFLSDLKRKSKQVSQQFPPLTI